MKLKLLLIVALILTGCRSKKMITEELIQKGDTSKISIVRVVDTIYKDRVLEKTRPVYSELIIEKPCDSLGKINQILATIGSGADRSSIRSEDGKLIMSQYIDATQNVLEKEYRSKYINDSLELRKELLQKDTAVKETVRYVYPWWFYLVLLGAVLVIFLRVVKPINWLSTIKSFFRI